MNIDYRASLAVGGSDLRLAAKDFEAWSFKRRLRLAQATPPWLEDEPTAAMEFGTAVHMAILEPERYREKAICMPYVESFAVKAGKDIKAQAIKQAEAKNGFILRAEHAWAIERIIENFEPFRSLFPGQWSTEQSLVKGSLKGTADLLTDDYLVDLKTTRDILKIEQIVIWEKYGIQLAHYLHLFPRPKSAVVFIENEAPYRVRVLEQDGHETIKNDNEWKDLIGRMVNEGLLEQPEDFKMLPF